jgi:thiamine-monophosphate kinase
MKLQDIGEFGFIDRISAGCLIRPDSIVQGIGDDAAVIHSPADEVLLVTTDLLVERVHFLRTATTGFNLGHKALAVNLSDIAAMGGTACEAFVSVAIPDDCGLDYLDDIYRGMKDLAARHRVNILGGDTTGSRADLVINVAVAGTAPETQVLFRSGAQVGDVICVTGYLGDSRAGLHLILNSLTADTPALQTLFEAHILPRPRLGEGRFLAACGAVRAAIDLSDGLSSDLGHILSCSRVGARIEDRKLPLSASLIEFCRQFGFDPVNYALAGGEDYSLLCTIDPEAFDRVAQAYARRFDPPLFAIGEITGSGCLERVGADGRIMRVSSSGWDHFKNSKSSI